jgi:Holliday junction resolvasome RuvABC endonuclease subunit
LKKYEAEIVLIEGYSFASQGRAVLSLAEFGGVLRMALLSLAIRIVEVPPSCLKKFVCGKGNAGKTDVIAALARQHDIGYSTNDEYDALGLWLMGRVLVDGDYATNKTQTEAVGALHG